MCTIRLIKKKLQDQYVINIQHHPDDQKIEYMKTGVVETDGIVKEDS